MDKIKYALFAFAMAVPVLLAAERAAQADSSEVKRRPKVGVVLSGGGAKGFAHLGAIKVMERAGIYRRHFDRGHRRRTLRQRMDYRADRFPDKGFRYVEDSYRQGRTPLPSVLR